jgi:hypothetical protein
MNPILMAVVGVLVGAIVAYLVVNAKNASAQKSKEGAAADILAKAQADAEEVKLKKKRSRLFAMRETVLKMRWKKRRSTLLILSAA